MLQKLKHSGTVPHMKKYYSIAFKFSILLSLSPVAQAAELFDAESVRLARAGSKGMIVADDAQAAEWGVDILRRGGNAIDAAVATAFGMAVTRPHFASLGGGGFLIFCPAPRAGKPSDCGVIDFREKAPGAAQKDMYLRNGKALSRLSQNGALASGVPGVTAGLLMALEKYGTMKRQELLSAPISWAQKGIRVSTNTEYAAKHRWNEMNAEARRVFGCNQTTRPCRAGEKLVQPDLARVLKAISKAGAAGFYEGNVGRKIASGIQAAGGIISMQDLSGYSPTVRTPVRGQFKGYEVVTMPPPSSGGTVLVQLLGYFDRAEKAGLLSQGFGSALSLHTQIHGMSLSFADRAEYMGDSDFHPVPLGRMLSENYLDERWKTFVPSRANFPDGPGVLLPEPQHTTHFSVIDSAGNAVAITETVNDNFGSGFVPPGTGIVMNNEMDDFSLQPGVPNLFGLVGAEANAIAPGKRPLSSMSPTIVRDSNGHARIVLGAAGGPRIITSVFQTLANRIQFGMSLVDSVAAARVHHQWKPSHVRIERNTFSPETQEKLRLLGYSLEAGNGLAVVHALERFPDGRVVGAPDPRGEGAAIAE
jgi:gamma-glutamyltranspeptidase/glutathione hydrolase